MSAVEPRRADWLKDVAEGVIDASHTIDHLDFNPLCDCCAFNGKDPPGEAEWIVGPPKTEVTPCCGRPWRQVKLLVCDPCAETRFWTCGDCGGGIYCSFTKLGRL